MMKGKAVTLRAMELPDLERLRVMRNEHLQDNIFRQYRPLTSKDQEGYWEKVVNSENFVVFVVTAPVAMPSFKQPLGAFAVIDGKENPVHATNVEWQVIGEVRVGYINWRNRWAELGIFLGKEHMGKGYGRDALYLMMDYAFNNLNLHCVRAETVTPVVADIFREFHFVDVGVTGGTTYFKGEYRPDIILDLFQARWWDYRDEIYANAVDKHVEASPPTF